ncbi:homoserine O-acetyltransferase [bacterium SCSIO 12696]|nr:homoserine O-acetyltransferase [bacterium SCSIO 12696]
MPEDWPNESIGVVEPQLFEFDEPLELACGRTLTKYELVVETYGELNSDCSNGVLICHALSGHHHAAGYHHKGDNKPGWWNHYIGPGKPIDTDKFFVVSLNNIGGCHGSTGPSTTNPATDKPWGPSFPPLRVRDWVNSQARLADRLGIDKWAAVIGGSLGGMQAMRWALLYPERLRHCVVIASSMKLSAQNIAFNETARRAITSDRDYHDGDYLGHQTTPKRGLALARMIGHITYLSDELMGSRFGRELRSGNLQNGGNGDAPIEFQVESYLRHQGDKFSGLFDANTYLLMTKALDYFDLARDYEQDPVTAFKSAQCDFLVVSFSSDWRFAPERSKELVDALIAAGRNVSYADIKSPHGHDAFLLPDERYGAVLGNYMQGIAEQLAAVSPTPEQSTTAEGSE